MKTKEESGRQGETKQNRQPLTESARKQKNLRSRERYRVTHPVGAKRLRMNTVRLSTLASRRWIPLAKKYGTSHSGLAHILIDKYEDTLPRPAEKSALLRRCIGFHGWTDVRYSKNLVREITGVSVETFSFLLEQLPSSSPSFSGLTTANSLLVFLMKLKMDTPFQHLAAQFNVAPSTIEQTFMSILLSLAELTSNLIQWPPKSVVKSTVPPFIQRSFPQCILIADCLEIETEAPSQIIYQLPLRSNNTFKAKALIGLTPNGYVGFISKVYCGRITQLQLSKKSALRYLLDLGDEVLSLQPDSYFSVIKGIKVHASPIRPCFTELSVIYKEDAVSLNSHMDALRQRLRVFGILRSKVSLSLIPHLDSLLHVCAVLSNLEATSKKDG